MGTAEKVPDALEKLRNAANADEATDAYWQIDNTVIVQGQLFEAAVPTTACLVNILRSCSPVARPQIVELLGQIATGESDRSEVAIGQNNLKEQCIYEIIKGFELYKKILATGTEVERLYCLEILNACAQVFPDRGPEVLSEFQIASTTKSLPSVSKLAERLTSQLPPVP